MKSEVCGFYWKQCSKNSNSCILILCSYVVHLMLLNCHVINWQKIYPRIKCRGIIQDRNKTEKALENSWRELFLFVEVLPHCIFIMSSPISGHQSSTNGQEYFLYIMCWLVGYTFFPGTSHTTIIQDFVCTAAIHLPVTNCTWATQELQLNQHCTASYLFQSKGKRDENTSHWGFLLYIGTTWTHLKVLPLIFKGPVSKLLTCQLRVIAISENL